MLGSMLISMSSFLFFHTLLLAVDLGLFMVWGVSGLMDFSQLAISESKGGVLFGDLGCD